MMEIPKNLVAARKAKILKGLMSEDEVLDFLRIQRDTVTGYQIEHGCNMTRGMVQSTVKRLIQKKMVKKTMVPNFRTGKIIAYFQVMDK